MGLAGGAIGASFRPRSLRPKHLCLIFAKFGPFPLKKTEMEAYLII